MALGFPDMWSADNALASVAAKGGSDIEFSPVIESIDIDLGDKDFESKPTINGARLEKPTPEGDTTITFEGYPIGMDTAQADIFQRFNTVRASWDTSDPWTVTNSKNRDDFRVAIMFTDATSFTSASGAISGAAADRVIYTNCRLISVKPTHTESSTKYTFKFKCMPYNASGTANITYQSTSGGAGTFAALSTTY